MERHNALPWQYGIVRHFRAEAHVVGSAPLLTDQVHVTGRGYVVQEVGQYKASCSRHDIGIESIIHYGHRLGLGRVGLGNEVIACKHRCRERRVGLGVRIYATERSYVLAHVCID